MCQRVYNFFSACGCILQEADALHSCEFGAAHPNCLVIANKLVCAAVDVNDPYSGMCPYHKGQARIERRHRSGRGSDGSASSTASTPPADDTQPGGNQRGASVIDNIEYSGMEISWESTPATQAPSDNQHKEDEGLVLSAVPPHPIEQELRAAGTQRRHLNENIKPIPVIFGATSARTTEDLDDQDKVTRDQQRGVPDREGRLQRQPLRELSYTEVAQGGDRETAQPEDENRAGEEGTTLGAQVNNENAEPQLGGAPEPAQEPELTFAGWAPYVIFYDPIAPQ